MVRGAIAYAEGRQAEGTEIVRAAAVRADASEKHAVTPGPIKPAREVLGDLLMKSGEPADALREYEAVIAKEPDRLGPTAGAAQAAQGAGAAARVATIGAGGAAGAAAIVALALDERLAEAQNNLAFSMRMQGERNFAPALRHYDRAIELKPDLAQAWMYRGVLFTLVGDLTRTRAGR